MTRQDGRTPRIVVLPGDGVGPEVTGAALDVLAAVCHRSGLAYTLEELPFGGRAVDLEGSPYPDRTRRACLEGDAVFMGAVGGPKWDGLPPEVRPERGLFAVRRDMGAFANIRPIRLPAALAALSPLKPDVLAGGIDLVIVRELTGGLYFGPKRRDETSAEDVMRYTVEEVRRVAEVAFGLAEARSGRLTSVDKENVLISSRLWRETVTAVAGGWPAVKLSHMYVDNCAMQLVRYPDRFDVILTENTFGDILSDLGGALVGSLGLLPSASLGGRAGLYEPVHGSAPDIAGKGIANPAGSILSAAMMLRHTFGSDEAARAVEIAVDDVLASGCLTADLVTGAGPAASTREFAEAVARRAVARTPAGGLEAPGGPRAGRPPAAGQRH